MSRRTGSPRAASIRQRLKNRARSEQRPFAELLQYYAMERFLYRLSLSTQAQNFVLKGALMLRVWEAPEYRPTMDIDMLGKTSNDELSIVSQIKEMLGTEVEPDGLEFDTDSIQSERITEDADYQGIRIRFLGYLDSARINMQIDIGFGDIVHPDPEEFELPTMLDLPAPKMLCYSRESAIAEKFEAMVKLGILNSRMKDFYDIWLLSRLFNFDGSQLIEAIHLTFNQRGTSVTNKITAFQEPFIAEKQVQWTAFRRRLDQEHLPEKFADIINQVASFLEPVVKAASVNQAFDKTWKPVKGWN